MASCMALPYIRGFEIEKGPTIPTHSVVQLYLDLETVEETRTCIKTLPSLKSMLHAKLAKAIEDIEDEKGKGNEGQGDETRLAYNNGQATPTQRTPPAIL